MDKVQKKRQALKLLTEDNRSFQSWQFRVIRIYYSFTKVFGLCSLSTQRFSK